MSDYVSLLILNSSAHFTMTSISAITTKRPKKLHNYVIMCFFSPVFDSLCLAILLALQKNWDHFWLFNFTAGKFSQIAKPCLF